eukprot:857136-Pelagomonas_calceolata.AAC.2
MTPAFKVPGRASYPMDKDSGRGRPACTHIHVLHFVVTWGGTSMVELVRVAEGFWDDRINDRMTLGDHRMELMITEDRMIEDV